MHSSRLAGFQEVVVITAWLVGLSAGSLAYCKPSRLGFTPQKLGSSLGVGSEHN